MWYGGNLRIYAVAGYLSTTAKIRPVTSQHPSAEVSTGDHREVNKVSALRENHSVLHLMIIYSSYAVITLRIWFYV